MSPQPIPLDDCDIPEIDNDDATQWEVRDVDPHGADYYRDGVQVGSVSEVHDGLWGASRFGAFGMRWKMTMPPLPTRAEAEAWVCAQTGHPGTTTPPDEPGDCEGDGVPATPCPDCDDTGECPDCTAQGQSFLGCNRCDDTGRCHCWDGA